MRKDQLSHKTGLFFIFFPIIKIERKGGLIMPKNMNKMFSCMGAFVLSASILTAGSVMTINAAGNGPFTFTSDASGKEHCDQLKSTGTIKDGTSGKVLFNSSDITTLAEGVNAADSKITAEEGQAKSFKDGIISSLGSIGTGSTDNSYTYSSPKDLTSNSKLGDFQNVINGSQAITGYVPTGKSESLDKTQATDKDGNLLYYTDDTALSTKDLTKTTTDTAKVTIGTGKKLKDYAVTYQPASAANLTAGSAAWVNGQCILGTGSDNTAYLSIIKVGAINSGNIDVSKYYTDYKNLTLSNFFIQNASSGSSASFYEGSGKRGVGTSSSASLSLTYNPSTGILNTNCSSSVPSSGTGDYDWHFYANMSGTIYLIPKLE
jgi:hypothetical protein